MKETVLVLNAGSSSIKFALYEPTARAELRAGPSGEVSGIGTVPRLSIRAADGTRQAERELAVDLGATHRAALVVIRQWLAETQRDMRLVAAGHRVVHGGGRYTQPVRIDAEVLRDLEALVPLAPLHQPHNLAAIRAVLELQPDLPQVACFDTAFHRSQPDVAQSFALPRSLTDTGVKRYGFHGLSYEYVASVLPTLSPQLAAGRVIAAHLGNGASLCAMQDGRSVATTMGFTALDGLVMGTRCGSIDPGVLLYLLTDRQMDVPALEKLLYHQSGLLGVSGLSSDMRTLLDSDEPHAAEAVELFIYRIGREIGSLAAALGGLDALVFTGGIGENSGVVRERVCRAAIWLGVHLDPEANRRAAACITSAASPVSAWVVRTDENLMIARHAARIVG